MENHTLGPKGWRGCGFSGRVGAAESSSGSGRMTTKPPEKISIFVDVQNIYYTCRQAHGRNFDYNAFWARVTTGREVVSAFAYATDRGDEKQQQFQNILRAIGFTVLTKPFIERADGSAKAD